MSSASIPLRGMSNTIKNEYFAKLVPATEGRFDRNVVAPFGNRVEKIKGASGTIVPQLAIEARQFDIA